MAGPPCRRGAARATAHCRSPRPWSRAAPRALGTLGSRHAADDPGPLHRRFPDQPDAQLPRPGHHPQRRRRQPEWRRRFEGEHRPARAGRRDRRFAPAASPSPTPSAFSSVLENPSSIPSSASGGLAPLSFPYFPLYTVDANNGVVLFNGQSQQENLNGITDLYAQVKGASVSSYSWTTTRLVTAIAISGTSTYHLHLQWAGTNGTGANEIETVTLAVTDTSSHQESQTFYFVIPPSNAVTMPYSASWPVTLPPDLVEPAPRSSPARAWRWTPLPGRWTARSRCRATTRMSRRSPWPTTASRPMHNRSSSCHHTLDDTQSVPTKVDATLTFNSVAGTTWVYNTSQFIPGDIQQIALQANATGLSTGRYSYSVQVVDERSTNTTSTYSGTATVLNQKTSAFGDGWTLQGLEQVVSATGGVILSLGGNGESLWFSGSPGVGSNYTSPAGDFSTLTKTASGYTRTLSDGTQITFDTSGNQTATIDLNGLHTTYTYSSGLLSQITDPYGAVTTFTYTSGKLTSIQDPASRLATFTFTGNNLTAVQQMDGSHVTLTYDGSGRLTQYQDPLAHTTSISYDAVERVGTITRADGTTQLVSADQEQGWTNSGTSGSPASATLLAEAATTYTTPNTNSIQFRPDWMGLGQARPGHRPVRGRDDQRPECQRLAECHGQRPQPDHQYDYDGLGNATTITYPDLTNDQYTFNRDSEPLTHTDGNGHTTSYSYDGHGNLTGIQDPLNNLTTMTYTGNGRVQTVTDANNKTTSYPYDGQDRVTTVQFPDGTTNVYGYNSQGNVTQFTDGRSNATTYSYDALGRETGSTDALGDMTTMTRDAAGDVTQVQAPTPAGQTARTTNYAYDSLDRLTTVTDPLGNQTVLGHDADGNVTTETDPLGRVTTTVYDALDRPTVTIDPLGKNTTMVYDADGEKLTVTDPLGRTTSYSYSVRGWVSTETDPRGTS